MKDKAQKKVNFWTYFLTLNYGPNELSAGGRPEPLIFIVVLVMIWGFFWLGGEGVPIYLFLSLFGALAVGSLARAAKLRPSLFNLMPIGRVRKAVFFFLDIAVTTVIGFLASVIAIAVVGFIIALIVLAASGEWIILFEDSGVVVVSCLQGELFALALTVAITGACMALVSIRRKLLRRILMICLPFAVLAPLIAMLGMNGIRYGALFTLFDTIPYSLVYLIVYAVIAVALAVVGTLCIIRFLRQRDI